MSRNFYTTDATQIHALGQIGQTDDGRVFRYVKAGGALVAGEAIQSPAVVPNHLGMVAVATAAGSLTVSTTLGSTLSTVNQYAGGYLSADTGPGNGINYGIASHPAAASGAAIVFTLNSDDPIQVAFSSATRLGVIPNKYNGVIQFPVTTATGTLVGVAAYAIASGSFGWIQTKGIASPLIAGTPALGAYIMSPGTTAGASVIITTTNLVVAQLVGRMCQIGVGGKNNFVDLDID